MTTKAELQRLFFTKLLKKYGYDSTELINCGFYELYMHVVKPSWQIICKNAIEKNYDSQMIVKDVIFKKDTSKKVIIILENGFEYSFGYQSIANHFESCFLINEFIK